MTPNERPAAGGFVLGLSAYGLWGLMPLYVWAVVSVGAIELMSHRIVWSLLTMAVVLAALGRARLAWDCLRRRRTARLLAISTTLIGLNWLTFLYAVVTGQVLQTSLGYFIGPLVNVALGVLVLGERLRPAQKGALVLALTGITVPLWAGAGGFPWIALTLAFAFGLYGLCRKQAGVDGLAGTAVEALFMLPFGLAGLAWVWANGTASFGSHGLGFDLLLMASGPVTAVPLVLYAMAVARLKLSTMGFMQYVAPSISFLVAVLALGEEFTLDKQICFGLIWAALAVFTWDLLRQRRSVVRPRPPAVPVPKIPAGLGRNP